MSDDVTESEATAADAAPDDERVPAVVYWIAAGLLALGGLVMAASAAGIGLVVGEDLIAEVIADGIASGDIETGGLTEAQVTAIGTRVTTWLGVGLAIAGVALFAGAAALPLARQRQSAARSDRYRLLADGLLGGVATTVLSFVPVSSVLGGGVAGYANAGSRRQQTIAGAIAGVVVALPTMIIALFLAVGLALGFQAAGLELVILLVLVTLMGLVAMAVYFVGLSALGGYVAARLTEES